MNVSAIIVTYNRLTLLKECLIKLLNQNYELDNIFIINNKSTDGTKKYLNHLNYDKVKPVNLDKNLGGAGGFSLGLKFAFEQSNSDDFWLMDDDTIATNFSLSAMMNKASYLNNNFGFLCSNVRWWKNNKPSLLNIPVVDRTWNEKSDNGIIKLKSASFVSILISRKAILKLGLPISEMFIWADDVEYTTRISNQFSSYFVPESIVIHKCANNNDEESIINANNDRIFYYKCMFRNRLYIYRKYYNFKYFSLKILIYLSNFFIIPFKSKNHRLKRMIYTIEGVWNGLFFNPKIQFPNKKN